MALYDDRVRAPQAGPAWGVAAFSAILLLLAVLAHWLAAIGTSEFAAVLAIVAALAFLALFLAGLALRRVWVDDDEGIGTAVAALALGCAVLAPFAAALFLYMTQPPLTDLSTDAVDPPAFDLPSGGDGGTVGPVAAGDIAPHLYPFAMSDIEQAARQAAEARGLRPLGPALPSPGGGMTHRFAGRTLVLALPFDVALRLREENGLTRVDMRVATRYGAHDLGMSIPQMSGFLDALDAQIDALDGISQE